MVPKKINNVFYIADLSLPSLRAYTIHVIKMVDNFNYFASHVELLIHHHSKNFNINQLEKDFMMLSKQLFCIKKFLNTNKNNFFSRLAFGYLSANYLKDKKGLIITRSFMCSFFLILFKKKHFLEIHHDLRGLTKFLFLNLNFISSKFIIKLIFITKSLQKYFNNYDIKSIVLADAVELNNFKKVKLKSKVKNIMYIGSFYKGRGIDLILNIAQKLKNKNFLLYGKRKNDVIDVNYIKLKNVKIFDLIKYSKVPLNLIKADILLMPYSLSGVSINSLGNDDTSKFASPIKMFEYLASGVPFISSDMSVLKEILLDKTNCIIAKDNSIEEWVKAIELLESNLILRKKIVRNALICASKNTWFLRTKAIVNEYLKCS